MSEEQVNIKQLFHGSHDLDLKQLVPRPLTNLDTFGIWLSDIKSASSYGPTIYKVTTDKSVLLDEYYDLFDMFDAFNMSKSMSIPDMKRIRSKLENMRYDGFKLTMLDGMAGYFVCLFTDYPIKVIKEVKGMAVGRIQRVKLLAALQKIIATSGVKTRWQKYAEENGENIDLAGTFNFNDYVWSFEPNYPLSKFLPETLDGLKDMYLKDKKTYGGERYTDKWEKEVISEKDPIAVLVEFRGKVYDIDDGGGILDGNHRVGLFAALKMKTIPTVVGRPKNPALFYKEWVLL